VLKAGVCQKPAEIEKESWLWWRDSSCPSGFSSSRSRLGRPADDALGKKSCSHIKKIADGYQWGMPSTIEDPKGARLNRVMR